MTNQTHKIVKAMREAVSRILTTERVDEEILSVLGVNLPDDHPLNERQFTYAMIQCFLKVGVPLENAKTMARDTLAEMLKEDRIQFGDPAYTWDRRAAQTVCQEYQFDYWEA
jgi:hypothetical protein